MNYYLNHFLLSHAGFRRMGRFSETDSCLRCERVASGEIFTLQQADNLHRQVTEGETGAQVK